MNRILVLCSGGLDSTVLLWKAANKVGAENVIGLSCFYGQKHAKEMEYAKWQCEKLGIKLYHSDLSAVFKFNPACCSLLKDSNVAIEHGSYAEQLDKLKEGESLATYVPFRNGLFLAYAAAVALQLNCDEIYYGAHSDDAAGNAYPDCTSDFIEHMCDAIYFGSGYKVDMSAPWWDMTKADVVAQGLNLGMTEDDFRHTWSCYEGQEEPCGECGTCIDRKKAFELNGIYNVK